MRLIDADAAIKDARLNYGDVHDAVLMEHFLNSQPMVEVVVKCKDCTHYGDVGDCEVHPHDGRFNREYFCADGEYKNPEQLPNAPLTLQELREIYDGEQGPIWIKYGLTVIPAILDIYDGELMAIWSALGKDDALSEKTTDILGSPTAASRRRMQRMKKSEIKIGHTYSNGRGRERRVIDIGPQYKLYDAQESVENMRYEVVKDGCKENRTAGTQHNMTLAAFAAWAKEEVG